MSAPLRLDNPLGIRAEMARNGLMAHQLLPYDDPERGWIDPLNDSHMKAALYIFMGKLWEACLQSEGETP